jgi:thymidylate synthase ThyX
MKIALKERHPFAVDSGKEDSEEKQKTVWGNAINARAFDVCRSLLPAGTSTNLAWTTTLRQFADRIAILRNHPLEEVREIGEQLEDGMIEMYENSFQKKRYEETESYLAGICRDTYYYHNPDSPDLALVHDGVWREGIKADARYEALIKSRPPKTELPKWLGAYGSLAFAYTLDFGSFRDVQRQRSVVQRMPLLTADIGFAQWYLDEMPEELRTETEHFIASQREATESLDAAPEVNQYYLPMGYEVSCLNSGDLPAWVYIIELRASSTVHPTLAFKGERMAKIMEDTYGDLGLKIHLGSVAGQFDVRRGKDTIEERNDT